MTSTNPIVQNALNATRKVAKDFYGHPIVPGKYVGLVRDDGCEYKVLSVDTSFVGSGDKRVKVKCTSGFREGETLEFDNSALVCLNADVADKDRDAAYLSKQLKPIVDEVKALAGRIAPLKRQLEQVQIKGSKFVIAATPDGNASEIAEYKRLRDEFLKYYSE